MVVLISFYTPWLFFSFQAEELRKRVIQESKYLGGDMKHTHLVKGLDYALLQKVLFDTHQFAGDV